MKGLSYVAAMLALWSLCLVIIGASARVMWWLLELEWSVL